MSPLSGVGNITCTKISSQTLFCIFKLAINSYAHCRFTRDWLDRKIKVSHWMSCTSLLTARSVKQSGERTMSGQWAWHHCLIPDSLSWLMPSARCVVQRLACVSVTHNAHVLALGSAGMKTCLILCWWPRYRHAMSRCMPMHDMWHKVEALRHCFT